MNATKTKVQAIVEANSVLNFDNLPTYTDLATAAAKFLDQPNDSENYKALNDLLNKIPGLWTGELA